MVLSLGGGDSEGEPGARSEVVMSLASELVGMRKRKYNGVLVEFFWDFSVCTLFLLIHGYL